MATRPSRQVWKSCPVPSGLFGLVVERLDGQEVVFDDLAKSSSMVRASGLRSASRALGSSLNPDSGLVGGIRCGSIATASWIHIKSHKWKAEIS